MIAKALTIKQENFCQAYLRLGDKSAAYREAYSCGNMQPATINNKAYILFNKGEIRARIEQLQQEALERNKITIDELVRTMAGMVRFDLADLYDENGALKHVHNMPKEARLMITQIESLEEYEGYGKDRVMIGHTKKIKTVSKLDAIEKLMKHLGGYEKDNGQKKSDIHITWKEEKTYEANPKADKGS